MNNEGCIFPYYQYNGLGFNQYLYTAMSVVKIKSDFENWCGQKNRSSKNFEVPSSGDYLIDAPEGVSFEIMHDYTGLPDTSKGRFMAGRLVHLTGKSWKTGYMSVNYYIANPKGTNRFFEITFTKKG